MKPFIEKDYSHYSEKPVPNRPWNPRSKPVADKVLKDLSNMLKGYDAEIRHMGSTALEIAGKNDIEIYIHPKDKNWEEIGSILTKKFGEPGHAEPDFIGFNDKRKNFDVEIIEIRGAPWKMNKAMHKYFSTHPKACREYEEVKKKYSYSKRDYQIHKDRFFARIAEKLPEDYVNE